MSFIGGQPSGSLSPTQIYQLAIRNGFQPGHEAATATAIAMAESRGIPNNFNPNDPHGGSVGLMQINGVHAPLIGGNNWQTGGTDPNASMAAAHAIYSRRGNFSDWGTFTNGSYKPFYNQAAAIATSTSTPTPTPTPTPGTLLARAQAATTPPPGGPPASSGMFPAGYPGGNPPAAPSAVAAAPAAPPPQNIGDWIKKGLTRPPPTKDAQGNAVQSKSPLEQAVGAFKPQQQAPAATPDTPQQQLGLVQDPTAQMMGPSQQLLTAAIAAGAKPLSWSARPFGYQAGQQMGDYNG